MKGRTVEIDIAKGLLILFVLLGHSPINKWAGSFINSFHMAAFFFLSGLTYSYKGKIGTFIKKKTKGIILPYFEFSVILLSLAYIKHATNIGGGDFNLYSGIESIFFPISGRTATTVYGLWFLPCLYLIELVVAISEWLNAKVKHADLILEANIVVICIVQYTVSNVASIISILPIGLVFLLLGKHFKSSVDKIRKHRCAMLLAGLLLFAPAVYLNVTRHSISLDLSSMSLGCWPLYLLSCFGGTVTVLAFSFIVKAKVLSLIGKNSLYYYGLHYCIIGIVSKVVGNVWCMLLTLLLTTPLVYGFKYVRKRTRFL